MKNECLSCHSNYFLNMNTNECVLLCPNSTFGISLPNGDKICNTVCPENTCNIFNCIFYNNIVLLPLKL